MARILGQAGRIKSSSMKVVWSRRAIRQLIALRDFIAIDSEANAGLLAGRILAAVELLHCHPPGSSKDWKARKGSKHPRTRGARYALHSSLSRKGGPPANNRSLPRAEAMAGETVAVQTTGLLCPLAPFRRDLHRSSTARPKAQFTRNYPETPASSQSKQRTSPILGGVNARW